jgi:hypothetical protein
MNGPVPTSFSAQDWVSSSWLWAIMPTRPLP